MGRFNVLNRLRGLGRTRQDKKLIMGVNPSGMNYYTHVGFTYDDGKRCAWRLEDGSPSGSFVCPLDFPYVWPTGTTNKPTGWNTSLDGSPLSDLAESGPTRNTIKMDLDGTIDMTTLPTSPTTTALILTLPNYVAPERISETYQVQFSTPVPGAVMSGSGFVAGSWVKEDSAGKLWRFKLSGLDNISIKIRVPNNSTAVPSLTIRRPRIVPHPTLGTTKVYPEPIGYPPEVARLKTVGRMIRTLDLGRYNFRSINGDTLTDLRYRDVEPNDYLFGSQAADAGQPIITLAEQVAIANEAGVGLWAIFSHRDSQTLCLQHAQTLKALNGPLVVEYSNEVWNTGFIQNTETIFEGLRRGFAKVQLSASAQGETMLLPYRHPTSASSMDHLAGDKVITILPSYGTCVFRARTAVAKNTPFPSANNPNAAYATNATTIAKYPQATVYIAIRDIPANSNIALTNTFYWRPTTDADATVAPWDLYLTSNDAVTAREHWRAYMTNFIQGACDAARAAVGKAPVIRVINVQVNVTSVRNDATGVNAASNTEPARMLEFDTLWRHNPWVLQSVYLLGDQFPTSPSQQPWVYSNSFTSGAASLTAADKQLLYTNSASSDLTQVNALADKMLSDDLITYMRNTLNARRISFATTSTYSLQTFLNKQRKDWNDANPGDQVPPLAARVGEYEVGIEGGISNKGWPEEASQWSASASYTAGYAQSNFVKIGSPNYILYRCKGTPTVGLSPASDPSNWEAISQVVDFDGVTRPRICALLNAIYHHPKAYALIKGVAADTAAYAANAQGGYYLSNVYSTIRQMVNFPTSSFGYRFDFETNPTITGSPVWMAAAENFQSWEALP